MTLKGQQYLSLTSPCRISTSTRRPHTTSCATTAWEIGKRDFMGVELIDTVIPGCALSGRGPRSDEGFGPVRPQGTGREVAYAALS